MSYVRCTRVVLTWQPKLYPAYMTVCVLTSRRNMSCLKNVMSVTR